MLHPGEGDQASRPSGQLGGPGVAELFHPTPTSAPRSNNNSHQKTYDQVVRGLEDWAESARTKPESWTVLRIGVAHSHENNSRSPNIK